MTKQRRWTATIKMKDDTKTVIHNFDEIEMLHDIMEDGPVWYDIEYITIKYNYDEEGNYIGSSNE